MRFMVWCLALLLGFHSAVIEAAEAEYQVGTERIVFEPGDDYCAIDSTASDYDDLVRPWHRPWSKERSELLALFVACKNADVAPDPNGKGPMRWSALVATLLDGRLEKVEGYSRRQFVDKMADLFSQGIKIDMDGIQKEFEEIISEIAPKESSEAWEYDIQPIGYIHKDEFAVYGASVGTIEIGDYQSPIVGLMATTIVKKYQISYYVYSESSDKESVKRLLEDAGSAMRQLALRNGPPEGEAVGTHHATRSNSDDGGSAAEQRLRNALWSAIAFLVIGGILWLFRKIRGLFVGGISRK